MKRNKKIIIATVIVIVIALLTWAVISFISFLSLPKEEKAEKDLTQGKKHFEAVASYLLNNDHDYVYFLDDSGYVYEGYKKAIEDKSVAESLKYLFNEKDYKSITKDGNTIRFVKWTRFNDFEAGICFVTDGVPLVEFLTSTTPLSVNGWYYYEADYNEWRSN